MANYTYYTSTKFADSHVITSIFGAPGASSLARNQTSDKIKGKIVFSHILPQVRKNVNKEVTENNYIALGYNVPSDDPKFGELENLLC